MLGKGFQAKNTLCGVCRYFLETHNCKFLRKENCTCMLTEIQATNTRFTIHSTYTYRETLSDSWSGWKAKFWRHSVNAWNMKKHGNNHFTNTPINHKSYYKIGKTSCKYRQVTWFALDIATTLIAGSHVLAISIMVSTYLIYDRISRIGSKPSINYFSTQLYTGFNLEILFYNVS